MLSVDGLPEVMEKSGRHPPPAVALLAELLAAGLLFTCLPRPGNDQLCFLPPGDRSQQPIRQEGTLGNYCRRCNRND